MNQQTARRGPRVGDFEEDVVFVGELDLDRAGGELRAERRENEEQCAFAEETRAVLSHVFRGERGDAHRGIDQAQGGGLRHADAQCHAIRMEHDGGERLERIVSAGRCRERHGQEDGQREGREARRGEPAGGRCRGCASPWQKARHFLAPTKMMWGGGNAFVSAPR